MSADCEAATKPGRRPRPAGRRAGRDWPVAAVAALGVAAILLQAGGGRGGTHVVFLSILVVESTIALRARHRHPGVALGGVLLGYAAFYNPAVSAAPVLLGLFAFARERERRWTVLATAVTAIGVLATPLLHDGEVPALAAAVALAALASALIAAGFARRSGHLGAADEETAVPRHGSRGSRPGHRQGGSSRPYTPTT